MLTNCIIYIILKKVMYLISADGTSQHTKLAPGDFILVSFETTYVFALRRMVTKDVETDHLLAWKMNPHTGKPVFGSKLGTELFKVEIDHEHALALAETIASGAGLFVIDSYDTYQQTDSGPKAHIFEVSEHAPANPPQD